MQELTIGQLLPTTPDAGSQKSGSGSGFGEMLGELLTQTSADQSRAEQQASALVEGDADIVDTMIAIGRAELSMRLVVSLRNRALEAYQEIMRLQV